jgi:hypothetical protein
MAEMVDSCHKSNVKVCIRIRPLDKEERKEKQSNIVDYNSDNNGIRISNCAVGKKVLKDYKFDNVGFNTRRSI